MASFGHFLGRRVTVQYRVGDVLLPASGTFAADSGRSIFLEQHVEQKGKRSYFRWEIPYQFIHRIESEEERVEQPAQESAGSKMESEAAPESRAAAAGAGAASATTSTPSTSLPLMSLPQRPKTA